MSKGVGNITFSVKGSVEQRANALIEQVRGNSLTTFEKICLGTLCPPFGLICVLFHAYQRGQALSKLKEMQLDQQVLQSPKVKSVIEKFLASQGGVQPKKEVGTEEGTGVKAESTEETAEFIARIEEQANRGHTVTFLDLKKYERLTGGPLDAPLLEDLDFSVGGENLTLAELDRCLSRYPNIKRLDFRRCALSQDMFIAIATRCPKLEYLDLSGCSKETLENFFKYKKPASIVFGNLKHIKLTGCQGDMSLGYDHGISRLASLCPNLERMDLSGCSESIILNLFMFPDDKLSKLTYVDLSECNLSEAALKEVGEKCPHLQTLYLTKCVLSDDACFLLGMHYKNLQVLDLSESRGASLKYMTAVLLSCKELRSLDLRETDPDGQILVVGAHRYYSEKLTKVLVDAGELDIHAAMEKAQSEGSRVKTYFIPVGGTRFPMPTQRRLPRPPVRIGA